MKKKLNTVLIGSNFVLKSYLPVIKKISRLNLKIICSKNILTIKDKIDYYQKITLETDWKILFEKKIDLIICAVPPLVQEKILIYNLKYKKKIIFEKPISSNFLKSTYIVKKIKVSSLLKLSTKTISKFLKNFFSFGNFFMVTLSCLISF